LKHQPKKPLHVRKIKFSLKKFPRIKYFNNLSKMSPLKQNLEEKKIHLQFNDY